VTLAAMPRAKLICIGGPLHGELHEDYGRELTVPRMLPHGAYTAVDSIEDSYRQVKYRPRGWGPTTIYAHESLTDMDAAQIANKLTNT
jgi:hypothetical protein